MSSGTNDSTNTCSVLHSLLYTHLIKTDIRTAVETVDSLIVKANAQASGKMPSIFGFTVLLSKSLLICFLSSFWELVLYAIQWLCCCCNLLQSTVLKYWKHVFCDNSSYCALTISFHSN